ncbi:MAG: hypothetical protein ACPGLV_12350, partial [Bacteroidia bacterium]
MKRILLNIFFVLGFAAMVLGQTQVGSKIFGDGQLDEFGTGVSLSANGDTVAVGAMDWYNTQGPGYVKVLYNNSGTWTQIGSNIVLGSNGDRFGQVVELSASGKRVAIGSDDEVSVYEWNNSSTSWVRMASFSGVGISQLGSRNQTCMAFSADGNSLIVGDPE